MSLFVSLQTGNPENSCPLIQPPDRRDTLDYLIHSNMSHSLVIRAKNLHIFDSNMFFCTIKEQNGNVLYNISGQWNGTTVNCLETLVSLSNVHVQCSSIYLPINLLIHPFSSLMFLWIQRQVSLKQYQKYCLQMNKRIESQLKTSTTLKVFVPLTTPTIIHFIIIYQLSFTLVL